MTTMPAAAGGAAFAARTSASARRSRSDIPATETAAAGPLPDPPHRIARVGASYMARQWPGTITQ